MQNYGFDPLGLGKDPASLARFRDSEVFHGRWAMLGVAGCLAVELLGYGNWYDAPLWVSRCGPKSGKQAACVSHRGRVYACRTIAANG